MHQIVKLFLFGVYTKKESQPFGCDSNMFKLIIEYKLKIQISSNLEV